MVEARTHSTRAVDDARRLLQTVRDELADGRRPYATDVRRLIERSLALRFGEYIQFLEKYGFLTFDRRSELLGLTRAGQEAADMQPARLRSLAGDARYHFGDRLDEIESAMPGRVSAAERFDTRYLRFEPIGAGGLATVWRARQLSVDRPVAIKTLDGLFELFRPEQHEEIRRRFELAVRNHARLVSPFIVSVLDQNAQHTPPYLVMELAVGGSLRDLLRRGGLPPPVAVRYFVQMALALKTAHAEGILHRDLKPENVLLDGSGNLKVVDFGITRVAERDGDLVRQAYVGFGSVGYMAPECFRTGMSIGPAVDLYALGIILYEMLVGDLPGRRSPMPSEVVRGVPIEIDEIFDRMTQDDPDQRPPDIDHVLTSIWTSQAVVALLDARQAPLFTETPLELPGLQTLEGSPRSLPAPLGLDDLPEADPDESLDGYSPGSSSGPGGSAPGLTVAPRAEPASSEVAAHGVGARKLGQPGAVATPEAAAGGKAKSPGPREGTAPARGPGAGSGDAATAERVDAKKSGGADRDPRGDAGSGARGSNRDASVADELGMDESGLDAPDPREAGADQSGLVESGRDESGRDESGRDESGRDESGVDALGGAGPDATGDDATDGEDESNPSVELLGAPADVGDSPPGSAAAASKESRSSEGSAGETMSAADDVEALDGLEIPPAMTAGGPGAVRDRVTVELGPSGRPTPSAPAGPPPRSESTGAAADSDDEEDLMIGDAAEAPRGGEQRAAPRPRSRSAGGSRTGAALRVTPTPRPRGRVEPVPTPPPGVSRDAGAPAEPAGARRPSGSVAFVPPDPPPPPARPPSRPPEVESEPPLSLEPVPAASSDERPRNPMASAAEALRRGAIGPLGGDVAGRPAGGSDPPRAKPVPVGPAADDATMERAVPRPVPVAVNPFAEVGSRGSSPPPPPPAVSLNPPPARLAPANDPNESYDGISIGGLERGLFASPESDRFGGLPPLEESAEFESIEADDILEEDDLGGRFSTTITEAERRRRRPPPTKSED